MSSEQKRNREDLSLCVRCGGCKAFCPTYGEETIEGMGARGRMVLLSGLQSGELAKSRLLCDRIFSCILCEACSGTCPLGIDIPKAIYEGRALLRESDKQRRLLRLIIKYAAKWPDAAFWLARISQHFVMPSLFKRGIIPMLPELPDAPFKSREQVYKVPKKRGRVAIFTGCSVNYVLPGLGESLINVLQKFGYEVVLPKGETCCGAPLRNLGLEKEAAAQAKKNLRVFSRLKIEAILSPCPTCTMVLRHHYPELVGEGLPKAMDISTFFRDKITESRKIGKTALYHDPCHLQFGLGCKKEPRDIISQAGLDIIEPADSGCCGFGGPFCLSFRELSDRLLKARTENIRKSGADVVVTSCPGCILQLGRTITDRPVLHLIEVIEEAYCFRQQIPTEQDSSAGRQKHKEKKSDDQRSDVSLPLRNEEDEVSRQKKRPKGPDDQPTLF